MHTFQLKIEGRRIEADRDDQSWNVDETSHSDTCYAVTEHQSRGIMTEVFKALRYAFDKIFIV